jgi:GTP cyclohydrolase subunit MoaA
MDDCISVCCAIRRSICARQSVAAQRLDEIEQIIRHAVAIKPWGHGLPEGVLPTLRGMSELGG